MNAKAHQSDHLSMYDHLILRLKEILRAVSKILSPEKHSKTNFMRYDRSLYDLPRSFAYSDIYFSETIWLGSTSPSSSAFEAGATPLPLSLGLGCFDLEGVRSWPFLTLYSSFS